MCANISEMEKVRLLVIKSYTDNILAEGIRADFPDYYEKWQYYRSIGSNFCPRVMGVFHALVILIGESKELSSKYKHYFKV